AGRNHRRIGRASARRQSGWIEAPHTLHDGPLPGLLLHPSGNGTVRRTPARPGGARLTPEVTIIGAGPAGLTAARTLRDAGIRDILVLERNPEAGGLPRFAGHLGWGMLDFHR